MDTWNKSVSRYIKLATNNTASDNSSIEEQLTSQFVKAVEICVIPCIKNAVYKPPNLADQSRKISHLA